MAGKPGVQSELAREYRVKYGNEMPTRKLARIMYNDNPLLFKSMESARSVLGKIEGKRIGKSGAWMKQIDGMGIKEARPLNPYNLPESDEAIYEPFFIKGERILILSDIHLPYHSIPALTAAFDWAKKVKPDTILLNGDTVDIHTQSDFVKDPNKKDFAYELKTLAEFILSIRGAFPKASIIFKEGNHEERYNRFLFMKAKELAGVEEFALENIIRKRTGDIEYVGKKRVMKAGDLNIIHGHEFGGGIFSPVNIARGLFLKAKVSCLQGHNHQTSEHTESNMNGKITTTWSTGCLSELHPEYLPLNKWNHGFAFVEVEKDGDFDVQNKRIYNGEVL